MYLCDRKLRDKKGKREKEVWLKNFFFFAAIAIDISVYIVLGGI
jgi:hypothetical protein